jgi:hypothetical protein
MIEASRDKQGAKSKAVTDLAIANQRISRLGWLFDIIAGLTGGALVVSAMFGGRPAGAGNKHTI